MDQVVDPEAQVSGIDGKSRPIKSRRTGSVRSVCSMVNRR